MTGKRRFKGLLGCMGLVAGCVLSCVGCADDNEPESQACVEAMRAAAPLWSDHVAESAQRAAAALEQAEGDELAPLRAAIKAQAAVSACRAALTAAREVDLEARLARKSDDKEALAKAKRHALQAFETALATVDTIPPPLRRASESAIGWCR